MKYVAVVQKFGRVGIPHELREWLDIEEGDRVLIEILKVKKRNGAEVMTAAELMREHGEGD